MKKIIIALSAILCVAACGEKDEAKIDYLTSVEDVQIGIVGTWINADKNIDCTGVYFGDSTENLMAMLDTSLRNVDNLLIRKNGVTVAEMTGANLMFLARVCNFGLGYAFNVRQDVENNNTYYFEWRSAPDMVSIYTVNKLTTDSLIINVNGRYPATFLR
jgi:hypothetical protein